MVMVNLPAARRHHRSRITYALGLLALLGTATALALAVRHPAFSSTEQLGEPVPAPEITVVEGTVPPAGTEDEPGWAGAPEADPHGAGRPPSQDPAGAGAGQGALADPQGVRDTDVARSLFYSGLLGLAISLAGLGLVGTRRRQW
ncbi:hypothetical protein ONA70_20205 [Micromonospora yasonensis]|uniref:hypothetical protein n=1 Tax=Micromonospora yasonensis TaxID=1128667 RepID=UPI00222EB4FD|nr:hypothetical protein [Micromonospora yasonensis]MCW3842427.1 hypothetical protein [Micromonospora yasonensis]